MGSRKRKGGKEKQYSDKGNQRRREDRRLESMVERIFEKGTKHRR